MKVCFAIGRVGGNCPDDVLDHESSVLYCSSSVPAVLAIIHYLYVRRSVANSGYRAVATVVGGFGRASEQIGVGILLM